MFLVVILCCGMVGRGVLYENICRLRGFFRGEEVFSRESFAGFHSVLTWGLRSGNEKNDGGFFCLEGRLKMIWYNVREI